MDPISRIHARRPADELKQGGKRFREAIAMNSMIGGGDFLSAIRPEARSAPESGIVEVVNHGRLKQGLIPLWVGEGDLPTPDFIIRAAEKSLADGETFYTWQRGVPELREAIAQYHTALYGQ